MPKKVRHPLLYVYRFKQLRTEVNSLHPVNDGYIIHSAPVQKTKTATQNRWPRRFYQPTHKCMLTIFEVHSMGRTTWMIHHTVLSLAARYTSHDYNGKWY